MAKRKAKSTFGKGKLGSGSRFKACVKQMKDRPGVTSPKGLCAAIGRRAYGSAMMARMAQAGRAGNPSAESMNRKIVAATRNKYYKGLSDGIDDIAKAIAPMTLNWDDIYLEAAAYEQASKQYSVPIHEDGGGRSVFALMLSYYRMPSGNYEITAYVTRVGKGKRNPVLPPGAVEAVYKLGRRQPPPSVHTRTPKEALEYELARRKGETVGEHNPGSFREIGHYRGAGGGYETVQRLRPGTSDSDAWMMAKETAAEMGHSVVLVGRGKPVTVAAAGEKRYNPAAGQGFSTAVPKGKDVKTGTSATTYATNLSCPSASNSSRACPFLGSGCYAEYGRTNFTRTRVNEAANSKSPSPEEIAEDEALEITKKIVEPTLKKGTKFLPLRLHVVGDCVSNKAAQILAEAVKPILKAGVPVWTYNHAWHDVSRSAWGDISVLASCETVELAKQAMNKGYAAAMVVESFPSPRRFEQDGVKIQPCPNEAVSKNIKCAGGEGAKACKLCFDDKRLLREKTIIAFDAHSGGKKKIIQALHNIKGTKPGEKGGGEEDE